MEEEFGGLFVNVQKGSYIRTMLRKRDTHSRQHPWRLIALSQQPFKQTNQNKENP